MKKEWSPYQKAIFDAYENTDSSIAVKAGPGSGKSTVLVQLCKLTPRSKKSIFLAFNKSIVEELKEKLPSTMEIRTLHSLGMSLLFKEYGSVKVKESKTFGILKRLEKNWGKDLKEVKNVNYYLYGLSQLYDLYRMNLLTEIGPEMAGLATRYGHEYDERIIGHLTQLIKSMNKINRIHRGGFEIDFVDMIYLPIVQGMQFPRYEVVMVDESQDLNRCQHALVNRLLGRSSRLISVGDPFQMIYGFLGATDDSFEQFAKRPNTVTLPLSITYRCPVKVVEKINSVYDVVQAAPGAIEGEVRDGDFSDINENTMVLCRNNKPLLKAYFKLLALEKKSFIRGAEFGKGIVRMITPYKFNTTEICIERLFNDLEKLEKSLGEKGIHMPRKHKSYIMFNDNIELIKIIAENYNRVSDIIPIVGHIFKNDGEGIALMTIHKSKGLEADRVILLNPELVPSKFSTQPWEIEQEQKLLFVAYSRPKKELIFIRNFK